MNNNNNKLHFAGECPECGGRNTRSLDGGIWCMDCTFPEASRLVKELVKETTASVQARLDGKLH